MMKNTNEHPAITSLFACALALTIGMAGTACASDQGKTAIDRPSGALSFVVFGDSGYIPAYEYFDDDEEPFTTVEAYLTDEKDGYDKRHNRDEFKPSPMMFESSLGSFMPASGLYPVARAMDSHCTVKSCDFAVMLGDNIYPDGATLGADGISDAKRFRDMLDRPFGKFGDGVEDFAIYAMMGNHDWRISREATRAQMHYLQQHPKFYMPDYFYSVSPPASKGTVEIFVIDTEMLLAGGTVYKDRLAEDGSGREIRNKDLDDFPAHAAAQTEAERNMVAWLEDALRNSTARWKIVMAHHSIWSGGGSKYEKARALRKMYMPALCRYADAYFSGDDHMMEVYTDACSEVEGALPAPLPALVSGAAAKMRPYHSAFAKRQTETYPGLEHPWGKGMVWGFMHVTLENDQMRLQVLTTPEDMSGEPVVEAEFTFDRRTAVQQ